MSDALINQQNTRETCDKIAKFKLENFFSDEITGSFFGEEQNFRLEAPAIESLLRTSEKIARLPQNIFLSLSEEKLGGFAQVSKDLLSILQKMRQFHERLPPVITPSDAATMNAAQTMQKANLRKEREILSHEFLTHWESFRGLANILTLDSLPLDIEKISRRVDALQTQDIISKYSKVFSEYSSSHRSSSETWLGIGFLFFVITISVSHLFVYPEIKSLILDNEKPWQSILGLVFLNGFLLAMLSTLTFWAFRNYSINKHNELLNRLKSVALRSFKNFSESTANDKQIQHLVIKKIADTIFDLNRFGYLHREDEEPMTSKQMIDALVQVTKEKN